METLYAIGRDHEYCEVFSMENWIELDSKRYRIVWDKFYNDLKFNPSGVRENLRTFTLPSPFKVFDITGLYGTNFEIQYKELEESIIKAFLDCTAETEYIYALDWQHTSYLFNPHLESRLNEWGEWPITLYPNGDYYLFLNQSMSWGYLGHPWEKTISIFGEEFLKAIVRHKPKLFDKEL